MPDLPELGTDQVLARRMASRNLRAEFDGTFATETIEQLLSESYDQLARRATTTSLPLMAERFA